jgi:O-antigen ligase
MQSLTTFLRYLTLIILGSMYVLGTLWGGAAAPAKTWGLISLVLAAATTALVALILDSGRARDGARGQRGFSLAAPERAPRVLAVLALLFLTLVWLQTVDLPAGLLGFLSPRSAEIVTQNLGGLDGLDDWREAPARDVPTTVSVLPAATRQAWCLFAAGVTVCFVLVATVRTRGQLYVAICALLLAGALQAAIGLFQAVGSTGGVVGTYPNRNYFAGLLEMTAPLAIGLTITKRIETRRDMSARERLIARISANARVSWKIALYALFVIMFGATFLSRSRMGLIGMVVGLAALPFYLGRGRARRRLPGRTFWAVLLGVLLLLAASVVLRDSPTMQRFSLLVSGQDVGASTRLVVWRESLSIFADFPIFGAGLGAFGEVHRLYQAPGFQAPHFQYAHNDWLNLLVDVGSVGFVVIFLGLWLWLRSLFYHRDELRTYQKGLRGAIFAGVVAILCHSLVDFNLQVPANGLVFAGLIGVGTATGTLPELRFIRMKRRS